MSVSDVLLKYNRHTNGKSIEVSDDVFQAYLQLKDVRKELAELDERKEALEAKIKLAFTDAEALTHDGQTIATWRSPKPSRRFDTKRFQADHPDVAEGYFSEVQGARRLLLK